MNILYSLLKTIRPYNVFLSCITMHIAFTVYSRSRLLDWIKTNNNIEIWCYGVLVVFFYTSAANMINDIFDIKTDKINKPNRPLASNQLDKRYAIVCFLLLSICGCICSFKTNNNIIYFSNCIIFPIIFFYTPVFKNIPILGNLVISFILASIFLFIQLLIINTIIDYSLFILAFSFSFIREIGKDMGDIKGDKFAQIKTFPVLYNLKKSMYLVYLFTFLTIAISLWIFFKNEYNYIYLTSLIIAVYTPLFISIFSLQKSLTIHTANQFSKITKGITVTGMLTILLLEINIF